MISYIIVNECWRTLKQVYWFNPVPVALENPMIHGSAIHIAYRILAAFFIDMGAKTSIVENLELFNQLNGLWD